MWLVNVKAGECSAAVLWGMLLVAEEEGGVDVALYDRGAAQRLQLRANGILTPLLLLLLLLLLRKLRAALRRDELDALALPS